MNSSLFYPSLVVLHLIGLTLMAGTSTINAIALQTYWKYLPIEKQKADVVLQFLAKLARPIGIGAGLLVLTGLGLMMLTHGVYGEQTWFRIKFALVILLVANTIIFGRRQTGKLIKKAAATKVAGDQIASIRKNLTVFNLLQFLIFLAIMILSVFKFN